MKPELEKRCGEYIANRDAVAKAFRFDKSELHNVCANIFCAAGKAADTDRLKECRKIIRKNTGFRSRFRSKKVRSILASLLAIGEDPEVRMNRANDDFRLLKQKFRGTEYLVLTAFLLTDLADRTLTEETAARGKEIFRQMNQKHRLLTNKTDSVFAMLLAFSGKTDEELMEEIEACYKLLRAKFADGAAQTSAQVLAMEPGTPEEKAQRVITLYDALKEAGVNYSRSEELPPLAALSLAGTPVPDLVAEISEADAFLKDQGIKDKEAEQRAMQAVMIVSDQYAGTGKVNVTVMTNTLDMLFAKQAASRFSFALEVIQALAQFAGSKSKDKAAEETKEPETGTAGKTETSGTPGPSETEKPQE